MKALNLLETADVKKRARWRVILILAERKGFEPSIRYKRIHAFQACDFNHSSTSPDGMFRGGLRKRGLYGGLRPHASLNACLCVGGHCLFLFGFGVCAKRPSERGLAGDE